MKALTPTSHAIGSYPQPPQNPHFYLGKSKSHIEQKLLRLNYSSIEFMHWLYVLELGLVLSFDKQICVKVGDFDSF